MRNNNWKKIAYRRKRMMCEGAKEDGDLLYDVLSSPNDDGEEFIDVG